MAINPLPLAGVGVVALGIVGGLYATGTGTSQEQEPTNWHSLSEDNGYKTDSTINTAYANKYGQTYSRFLVGVTTKGTTTDNNDKWWEWSYKNRYLPNKAKATDEFAEGKIGDWEKLRDACKAAYGAETTNITDGKLTASNKKYKEEDFWTFCSSGGTKILTVKDKYSTETHPYNGSSNPKKLGKEHEDKLVAIEGNEWFWKIRLKDLINLETNPASDSSKFKLDNHKTMTLEHLKEKCQVAYGKTTNESTTDYPKADLGKFCSLSGEQISQ